VLNCNVLDLDIIPSSYGQFDAVSCLFCLEAACDTHRQYDSACRHLTKRLKSKGVLILGGLVNSAYYDAGYGTIFRNLYTTKQDVSIRYDLYALESLAYKFRSSYDQEIARLFFRKCKSAKNTNSF